MNTLEDFYLKEIVDKFKNGNESELFIEAVEYLFQTIRDAKKAGTFEMTDHFQNAIAIHARLRSSRYNEDFNGPLMSWYRRYIGLHGE